MYVDGLSLDGFINFDASHLVLYLNDSSIKHKYEVVVVGTLDGIGMFESIIITINVDKNTGTPYFSPGLEHQYVLAG